MIKNNFIYELDIDLDLSYIKNLVFEKQYCSISGMAQHHRLVNDDDYLSYIRELFPFLSKIYNIYTIPPFKGIPLHIDHDRNCALNIPIQGTKNTYTIFYDAGESPMLEYDSHRIYNLIRSPVSEIFCHTLVKPSLINNSIPHRVTNQKNSDRITVSWSIIKEKDFYQSIEHFK